MHEVERSACTRCDVTGSHGGPLCRRCRMISGLKFAPVAQPASIGLLPAAFQYLAGLQQLAGVGFVFWMLLVLMAEGPSGPILALLAYGLVRVHAVHQTTRCQATGWWVWAGLTLMELAVGLAECPPAILVPLLSAAMLAPAAVRQAAVESPDRGVPVRIAVLRQAHVMTAAALLITLGWRVGALATALAMAAGALQLVVPSLVIGCGGRGWRWWLALCAFNLAGGLLALPHSFVGLIHAGAGAAGLAVLASAATRTWARGSGAAALPPALMHLAWTNLTLRGLAAGAFALLLFDGALETSWMLGLVYAICSGLAVLGTLGGNRRCWIAWRGATLIDAVGTFGVALSVAGLSHVAGSSATVTAALLAVISSGAAAWLGLCHRLGATDVRAVLEADAPPPRITLRTPRRTPRLEARPA